MYRGKLPCPGCNTCDNYRRSKDDVCVKCEELLRLGRSVKADPTEFASIHLYAYGVKQARLVRHNKVDKKRDTEKRTTGMIYQSDSFGEETIDGSSKSVISAMQDLLKSVNLGIKDNTELSVYMDDAFPDYTYFVTPETATAFYELLDAIGKHSQRTHAEALEKGKSLLIGLSQGDITLKDFESK